MSSQSGIVPPVKAPVEQLIVVLGDQLNHGATALADADRTRDAVLMMEVADEATYITNHRQRIVLFLSAMRHFASELVSNGWRVRYVRLDDHSNTQSFTGEVTRAVQSLAPQRIRLIHPGDYRVLKAVDEWRARTGLPVDVLDDNHFLTGLDEFAAWRDGRRRLVLEHFYRNQRRRLDVLITATGKPRGGAWNFDADNRASFSTHPEVTPPVRFPPDPVTTEVIRLVERRFPDSPGRIKSFGWPVDSKQARQGLSDFTKRRLPYFGPFQDAMWSEEPFLYHSLLSPALNLKLLDPRDAIDAALSALDSRHALLQSVEGFVRQVIGWREFIRGVYWTEGPGYGDRNDLDQHGSLPDFYWTGETDMQCLRNCVDQVLEHGYGHHIQRLMVTGGFALTAGVHPRAVADWYLGMYVDAVDWVTLPNALGMVMHADGGVVGTKPYAASGRYIQRMSNYCTNCRYDPTKRAGPEACPFTVFYWDFLLRNRKRFGSNPRMRLALRHLEKIGRGERTALRRQAEAQRSSMGIGEL